MNEKNKRSTDGPLQKLADKLDYWTLAKTRSIVCKKNSISIRMTDKIEEYNNDGRLIVRIFADGTETRWDDAGNLIFEKGGSGRNIKNINLEGKWGTVETWFDGRQENSIRALVIPLVHYWYEHNNATVHSQFPNGIERGYDNIDGFYTIIPERLIVSSHDEIPEEEVDDYRYDGYGRQLY